MSDRLLASWMLERIVMYMFQNDTRSDPVTNLSIVGTTIVWYIFVNGLGFDLTPILGIGAISGT